MLLYSWAFRSLCSCDLHITPTWDQLIHVTKTGNLKLEIQCTKTATTMVQAREKRKP